VTLVLTTHYMDEAEQLCDRLVVMDAGKIAAGGTPRELIERYSTPEVLELRFDPADHQQSAEKLASVPAQRLEVLADRVLLYVEDATPPAAARAQGVEPLTSLVRRGTLEDVFLRLTAASWGVMADVMTGRLERRRPAWPRPAGRWRAAAAVLADQLPPDRRGSIYSSVLNPCFLGAIGLGLAAWSTRTAPPGWAG
jgi:hypothetical protein